MMQTHQQGKVGVGKQRTRIFSIIVALIMLLGATLALAGTRIIPTKAATSSYPYATMPCVWPPYATNGPKAYKYQNAWCKLVDKKTGKIVSYDDWGTIPGNSTNASEIDPVYGYAYRNCTDYVAWKLSTLGVKPQLYKGLGNAKDWANPPSTNHLTVNGTPAVGSAAVKTSGTFGHVAFVEKISKDSKGNTILTVSEFNEYFDGNYDTRTGTLAALGFSKFVHFEKYETGSPTPTPTPPPTDDQLNGVAVVTSNDVWAVGARHATETPQTLVEHWNGSSWNVVPSPSSGANDNVLSSVAAVSASDIWAVGYATDSNSNTSTLVEQWNGSTWNIVSSPSPGELHGIAVVSANDIWAVGGYYTQTLIEHWDGSSWSVVPSPDPGPTGNSLSSVAAVSASDVWAVGSYWDNTGSIQTQIEHWDGSTWTVIPSPNPGDQDMLYGASMISASDVWAVGVYWGNTDSTAHQLAEHWDGSTWNVVPSTESTVDSLHPFSSVAAVSANDVWAVDNVIEHWGGSSWDMVLSAGAGTGADGSDLSSVAVLSANDIWAVGALGSTDSSQTLIEHWDGSSWSVVPSPNP
ncbi:MAG: CHAP domain-containing protein [Ktedonobacteraceae bacterium]